MSSNDEKKCSRCKKFFSLNLFLNEKGNKFLVTCVTCRQKQNKPRKEDNTFKKNICETCQKRAIYNIKGETYGRFCKSHKKSDMINVKDPRCQYENCNKISKFNYKGQTKGLFCKSHMKKEMVNVRDPRCKHKDCYNSPYYNFAGEKAIFCKEHMKIGMIYVAKFSKCQHDGCNKASIYNFKGEKQRLFCSKHKKVGMVDIAHSICNNENCNKIAYYNFKGQTKRLFCNDHKEVGMVNIINKRCQYEDCDIIACFNRKGETHGIFCNEHKEKDMVNVLTLICKYEGCDTIASFNKKGETHGIFCNEHKEKDMINVKDPRCKYEGCEKYASFNKKGETKGIFCNEHKEKDMVNVKSKKCLYEECNKQPRYNVEGQKIGIFCNEHKEYNMVDVVTKRCDFIGCKTKPCFGYCSQKAIRCGKHKLNFMFNPSICKCKEQNCNEIAIFGIIEPTHCEIHSIETEICLLIQKCSKCGDIDLLNRDGLCITKCKPQNDFYKQKSYQKEKETNMIEYINKNLKDFESDFKIIDDKIIDTNCNMYRPDRRYDCGTHQLIIECDEHQHKNKEYCEKYKSLKHFEECRMFEIQQACGMNCIFIRWNPDTFRINGILCKKFNIHKRLEMLVQWIKYCINLQIKKESPPKYIQLFFDDYDETNTDFIEINEEDVIY